MKIKSFLIAFLYYLLIIALSWYGGVNYNERGTLPAIFATVALFSAVYVYFLARDYNKPIERTHSE